METARRASDLRSAGLLCALTVGWNVAAATAALSVAIATGSLALAGFGLDAAVDSAASAMLVWRFGAERRDPARAGQVESTALRVVGVALLLIALYLWSQAARSLATGTRPDRSGFGIGVAAASLVVLPPLAVGKLLLARRLGSGALRGDGILTAAGAVLAAVTLVGLVLSATLGWWWADALAAVAIGSALAWQGWRILRNAQPEKHGTPR